MDDIFSKKRERLLAGLDDKRVDKQVPVNAPEGLFIQCTGCETGQPSIVMQENLFVCPACKHHNKISADQRLKELFDGGKYSEIFKKKLFANPLDFPGYKKKLTEQHTKSGLSE